MKNQKSPPISQTPQGKKALEAASDEFADRLITAIGRENISSFARRAGVDDSVLRKYLKGSVPGLDKAVAIARAADVSLDWLATGQGPMKPEATAPSLPDLTESEVLARHIIGLGGPVSPGHEPVEEVLARHIRGLGGGAGGSVPVIGLAECGLRGWYQETPMVISATRPGDLFDPEAFAVIAVGTSMQPAGIRQGFLCFCSPNTPADKGDSVYIERRDATASIKVFRGADDEWLHLRGWLPPEDGRQDGYEEQVKQSEVARIATVVYIKVKL